MNGTSPQGGAHATNDERQHGDRWLVPWVATTMNNPLDCLRVRRTLQSFLDGQVAPEEAERVAAHLQDCSRCDIEAEVLTRVIEAIQRLRPDLEVAVYDRLVATVDDLTEHRPR